MIDNVKTSAKKADLIELLNFIPTNFHKFYTNLDHHESEPIEEIIVLSDEECEDIEEIEAGDWMITF